MTDCSSCLNKTCIKTGKPCQEIELMMKKEGIYSRDWIRPMRSSALRKDGKYQAKEVPFSSLTSEDKKELRTKYGDITDF